MNPQWFLPVLTSLALFGVIALLHFFYQKSTKEKAGQYRKSYLNLIHKTEKLCRQLNELAHYAAKIPHQSHLLDYYEGCLNMFENLLTMFKSLHPYQGDMAILGSAHFLVRDGLQKADHLKQLMRAAAQGKKLPTTLRRRHLSFSDIPLGCYFCSRPFIYAAFTKVRVKLEGQIRHVYSCDLCRHELELTKKVGVLYFMKDGRPQHWSQVKEYNPLKDYSKIQKAKGIFKKTHLELIYLKDDSDTTH